MKLFIPTLSAGILGALVATTAWAMSDPDKAIVAAEKARGNVVVSATTSVPPYQPQHFLRREAVSKLMSRQDTPDKIWYVYVHARGTGSILGYYASSTPPIPYCTAMTPTQERRTGNQGAVAIDAPSLDGTWGGSDCETRYFFDAATDALVMTQMPLTVLDQPLKGVDAPELKIEQNDGDDQ